MENNRSQSGNTAATIGIGFGSVLAALISWSHTTSVVWTFVHMIFGWFYVIYALIVGKAHLL
ncbi:MAG: hypothetical protein QME62_02335 [Armatimonadota bacterium]|nr:hypothetical protein [Armatimonadota bacterium]